MDRLCMEPKATAASPACCVSYDADCFEFPCNYIEERVTFGTALQRCEAWSAARTQREDGQEATPIASGSHTLRAFNSLGNVTLVGASHDHWHLYPFENSIAKESCADTTASTPTESECYAAASEAVIHGNEPNFNTLTNPRDALVVGKWTDRPAGCLVSTAKPVAYYNKNPATKASGSTKFKLVCNAQSFPAAADKSQVGSYLCPRKKKSCQTVPAYLQPFS